MATSSWLPELIFWRIDMIVDQTRAIHATRFDHNSETRLPKYTKAIAAIANVAYVV